MNLNDVEKILSDLESRGLLREPDDAFLRTQVQLAANTSFVDAASNDYLGMSRSAVLQMEPQKSMLRDALPLGSGASRLIFGSHPIHREVEKECALWLGFEEALLFSSGFAANCGVLPALISRGDAVFSDHLNHASMIDALRLAPAKPQVYGHLDLSDLEERLRNAQDAPARWVVTESYYSMDGDGPALQALHSLCRKFNAHLFVDEAHALGVFGPQGGGLCRRFDVKPDVLMSGFGKGVGSSGAIVACSAILRRFLWNKARSFVYSTAPAPRSSYDLLQQIKSTQKSDLLRERLEQISLEVRARLAESFAEFNGLKSVVAPGFGPILSLIIGSENDALLVAEKCRNLGVLVQAIRPPTVPQGESRLRITLKAYWSEEQVEYLIQALVEVVKASVLKP